MRHPNEGTLRRLIDEPAGVADTDREHVAGCPQCQSELAAAREAAAVAAAALGGGLDAASDERAAADVDPGWRRLSRALADGRPGDPVTGAGRRSRWRARLRSPVVVAVGVAVLLGGAGAAAATDWLPIFRTEQVAPISLTEADLVDLPDLSAYGTVRVVEKPDVHQVADAAAAKQQSGLALPQVGELPAGVTGEPAFLAGGQAKVEFTFSAREAARAAAAAGDTLPPPPPGLDGTTFRLVAGPGVAEVWSSTQDLPALVVARGVAPTGYSDGVSFRTARDYLLSMPGLPEDVARQLRAFSGDATTLPLPVPAGELRTAAADVDGTPATVLSARDGTMAGVIWVRDGTVTAVAGSLSTDEVLSVARGLR